MLGLLYVGLAYYYAKVFPYGTFINGVYCTGLDPKTAADMMNEKRPPADITVTMPAPYNDSVYKMSAEELELSYDYLTALNQYKNRQDPFLWIFNVGSDRHDEVVPPNVDMNEEKVRELISSWNVADIGAPHSVSIEQGEEEDGGFVLRNNKECLDPEACTAFIIDRIRSGDTDIRLDDTCVITPAYSKNEKKILKQYEAIQKFAEKEIVFKLDGENVTLNKEEIYSLLPDYGSVPDYDADTDSLVLTEESVVSGLYDVLSPFNTYNNHDFTAHDGRKVHLNGGTLGNSIDVEDAGKQLYDALSAGVENVEITPEYKHMMDDDEKSYAKAVGDTYIEISLDEQHMYYYEKGVLKLDTNVVTGTKVNANRTPEGVFYIYYMQKNRTLVGENYRSFVHYWMAFNRHVGIHDATWRRLWEEDAYEYNGSHGCVNTPLDKAEELYGYAYVGMPVIVYSYEKSLAE